MGRPSHTHFTRTRTSTQCEYISMCSSLLKFQVFKSHLCHYTNTLPIMFMIVSGGEARHTYSLCVLLGTHCVVSAIVFCGLVQISPRPPKTFAQQWVTRASRAVMNILHQTTSTFVRAYVVSPLRPSPLAKCLSPIALATVADAELLVSTQSARHWTAAKC